MQTIKENLKYKYLPQSFPANSWYRTLNKKQKLAALNSFYLLSSNLRIILKLRKWSNTHSSYSENSYQTSNQHLYFMSASQKTHKLYWSCNRKLCWHTESDWSYNVLAKAYYALSTLNTVALLSLMSPRNVNINTNALNRFTN